MLIFIFILTDVFSFDWSKLLLLRFPPTDKSSFTLETIWKTLYLTTYHHRHATCHHMLMIKLGKSSSY